MNTIENKIMVSLSYDELMNCKFVKGNRVGCLTREEAIANGASEAEWADFVKRAEKTAKAIKKEGWRETSMFQIAKDIEGNIYILDGQGRRMAIKLLNEDGINMENSTFDSVLYTNPMTIEEMSKKVYDLNTGNKNWSNNEVFASLAINKGGKVLEIKKMIDNYVDSIKSNYDITLNAFKTAIFFCGYDFTHLRNTPDKGINLNMFYDIYTQAYMRYVVNACYLDNNTKRTSTAIKKITNSNFAEAILSAFNTIANKCMNEANGNVEIARTMVDADIDDIVDRMLAKCDRLNDSALIREFNSINKENSRNAKGVVEFIGAKRGTTRYMQYCTAFSEAKARG